MDPISGQVLNFLVNALWQVPAVLALAAVCVWALRRSSMAQRHALWTVAMIVAVTLPLASLDVPLGVETRTVRSEAVDRQDAPAGILATRTVPVAPSAGVTIVILYLASLAWGTARVLVAWRGVRRIRREARPRPLTPAMRTAEERSRAALGLMPVTFLCSARAGGPLTVGDRDPIIVLPAALFEETSPVLLGSVIGHELAHIARRDYLQKIALEILFVPVAFHPAAWWLRRRIDRTRELACDELVTREMVDAPSYAQSMLDVARAVALFRKPECSLGVLDGDILEQRVRTLLRPGARFRPWLGRAAVAVAGMILLTLSSRIASYAFSAATEGRLSGRVFDAAHATVPRAVVTLIDGQTGIRFVRTTPDTGDYLFESLPVGTYAVVVEKQGFKRFQARVNPGRTHRINPMLEVGWVRESITVSTRLSQ